MFKRYACHFALILLFALAQMGAITHEISHANDEANHSQQDPSQQNSSTQNSSTQNGSKQGQSQKNQKTHSEQCKQCISFAKIASGLASQSFVFPNLSASFIGSTHYANKVQPQTHTAYAARAPPALS